MIPDPAATSQDHVPTDQRAALDVVNAYLTSFYVGDFEQAGTVVSDDFVFVGPFLQVESKERFFEGAEGLRAIVRGHRLLKQWADSNNVSSIYDVDFVTPTGAGSIVMSEWHELRDGELVSGRIIFDSAAFRTLVTPS
jgi:ketosteroid isomerase-like protein